MKKIVLLSFILALTFSAFSQQKKPLDHTVYDHWKDLRNTAVSDNGNWISYEINPQQGDGWLYFYDVRKATLDTVKNKAYRLVYVDLKKDRKILVSGDNFDQLRKGWSVSTHGKIYFNKAGFYTLNLKKGKFTKRILDDFTYNRPLKAKNAPEIIWRKESFRVYPDLHVSNLKFSDAKKISNTNPQQKNYLWGTVKLVHWVTFDGDSMQELLYKPANFDPNKKYPMLVYNGQPHNLSRRSDEKDLTRRMQQFFDYFLKGTAEPKWMKQGIPAVDKGRDFGFELEK